jgi:hypothetical protein
MDESKMRYKNEQSMADDDWLNYLVSEKASALAFATEVNLEGDVDVSQTPSFIASCDFYRTGNVEQYMGVMQELKMVPSWSSVARTNPSRSFDTYISNISIFWKWILESPEARIVNPHLYQKTDSLENEYFWSMFSDLPNGVMCDPSITLKLFELIYGSSFKERNEFPIALGPNKWTPVTTLEPFETFLKLTGQIHEYLFGKIDKYYDVVILPDLNYWSLLIPLVKEKWVAESGAFLLEHDIDLYLDGKMSDKDQELFRLQDFTRAFLGSLLGYHVDYESNEKFDRHDLDTEKKVLKILESVNWPAQYSNLIDFIHEHKEESMNESGIDSTSP